MPLTEWKRWGSALPLPSFTKTLSSQSGLKIQVAYELKYKPTKSNDWYFIADLQRSYQSIIEGVAFHDNLIIEGDGWDSVGTTYTLQELKVFPTDERAYPVIIRWATNKKTFRSKAFIYAKRLKYEGLLSYAAMMGAVTAINSKMVKVEQHKIRTLERLTNEILSKSDEWVVKLSKEALTTLKSDLGVQRGKQLQEEKQDRINQIKEVLSNGDFTKPNGQINKSKLADYLRVHRNTISSLLPLVMAMMILIFWIRPAYDFNPLLSISLGGAREGVPFSNC
jgi:hypothetical protein